MADDSDIRIYEVWTEEIEALTKILSEIGISARDYIWRGQRDSAWKLSSSLSRLAEGAYQCLDERTHLNNFKMAARGRRGNVALPLQSLGDYRQHEDEWWALGQHYGLATPFLDWSRAPFVALFFAFADETPPTNGYRTLFGLNESVQTVSAALIKKWKEKYPHEDTIPINRPPIIEIVTPLTDCNSRLVSQDALFTRSPLDRDIEQWILDHAPKDDYFLIKIQMKDSLRQEVLKMLLRMNISYASLFPDLSGAALHANSQISCAIISNEK